jgi:3-isopropylmalate dehydrogenase
VKTYRIAVFPGDGIGPEVMAVSLRVLQALEASANSGLKFEFIRYPMGAAHFQATGEVLPASVLDDCRQADAVYLAAIGLPDVRRPDGTEVQAEMMMGVRRELDLYAAVRPIKLYRGVTSCLRDVSLGIDFIVLRENTEGLFASYGGGASVGNTVSTDTMIVTRQGTERITDFAFRLAERRRKQVTCVDKANVFRSLAFFRKVFFEVAGRYPAIAAGAEYVDAMTLYMVRNPWDFDVLVMENIFGDILSDLGAGLVGGLGLAPSGEIGDRFAMFQPSHGSAPQLAGRDIANPLATILSAAMMLDWLGETSAARRIEAAVATVLEKGETKTPDIGGGSGTRDVGEAVIRAL